MRIPVLNSMGIPVSVRSPFVLPFFARACSIEFPAEADWVRPHLPEDLAAAVPARRHEFLAGRFCAARAMERLVPGSAAHAVGRGPCREPLWPRGMTGSITHTGRFASAAVASTDDACSIGIDTERLERFEHTAGLGRVFVMPGETTLGGTALPERVRLALIFSAKESIFKCLYPLVERRFYFDSVVLTNVNPGARAFAARVTGDLGAGIDLGFRIDGRFEIDDDHVHTGVWLPPMACRRSASARGGGASARALCVSAPEGGTIAVPQLHVSPECPAPGHLSAGGSLTARRNWTPCR